MVIIKKLLLTIDRPQQRKEDPEWQELKPPTTTTSIEILRQPDGPTGSCLLPCSSKCRTNKPLTANTGETHLKDKCLKEIQERLLDNRSECQVETITTQFHNQKLQLSMLEIDSEPKAMEKSDIHQPLTGLFDMSTHKICQIFI